MHVDHITVTLHTTVTQTPLSLEIEGSIANIRFRSHGSPGIAVLQTVYGPMELYIGQLCESFIGDDRLHTLRIRSYRYAIFRARDTQPLMRWEFVRYPGDDARYCRSHFQGPIRMGIVDRDGREGNLQSWHLPTGWVMIEEVLRFCIVDLGVTPLNDDWHRILTDSYEQSSRTIDTARS
jgi:hypothetical protein